jgi:hypothetical protein
VWVFVHILSTFIRERLWNDNKVICKFDKIVKGTLCLANAWGGMSNMVWTIVEEKTRDAIKKCIEICDFLILLFCFGI